MNVQQAVDTARSVIPAVANSIITVIEKMAQGLQVPMQELWRVLVLQGRVDGVIALVTLLCAVAGVVVLYRVVLPAAVAATNAGQDRLIPLWIGLVVGSIVCLVLFFANLTVAVTGLVNPEYLAIRAVLEAVK